MRIQYALMYNTITNYAFRHIKIIAFLCDNMSQVRAYCNYIELLTYS